MMADQNSGVPRSEVQELGQLMDEATLRAAIEKGIASGVAEPGVFSRVREKYSLPQK